MTLCMAWKGGGTVHLASDSRLKFPGHAPADVGIKVIRVPLSLQNAGRRIDDGPDPPTTELGMCFAGSVVTSLVLLESLIEVLRNLKYAPGITDVSMHGIAEYIFAAYKQITQKICESGLAENGIASILVAGKCWQTDSIRVFHLSTDLINTSTLTEVLKDQGHFFLGRGQEVAEKHLLRVRVPGRDDYLRALKAVIDDASEESVGGNLQYGCFEGNLRNIFTVYGFFEQHDGTPHFWRGGLDLSSNDLVSASGGLLLHGFGSIILN
jgi:hypothetical protein